MKIAHYSDKTGLYMGLIDVKGLLSEMGVEVCATPLSEMAAELDGTKEALRIANEQLTAACGQRDQLRGELKEALGMYENCCRERGQLRQTVREPEKEKDVQRQIIADLVSARDKALADALRLRTMGRWLPDMDGLTMWEGNKFLVADNGLLTITNGGVSTNYLLPEGYALCAKVQP